MGCAVAAGETGVVVGDVITLADGSTHVFSTCDIAPGAVLSFQYEDAMDPLALPEPNVSAPPIEPPTVTAAHTEAPAPDPATAPLDLAKLGGDNPLAVIVLAGIAILGGGTAWKFYSKKSEMSHELKMKELEMKAQPSTSPPPCIVKHGELDARLAAMEGKVGAVEKKTSSFSSGISNVEEIEERVTKIEKALKAAKKAGAK